MNTIQEFLNKIRDYINNPRKHHKLRQNKTLFSQLCSSLDVIGDTEEAIIAFESKEHRDDIAVHYLLVYGVLQAIYVQQDAVDNLCESLAIPEKINSYPILLDIRNIRNDAVGHPTKRSKPKNCPISYHHISRSSLSQTGFELLSFYDNGTSTFRQISIPGLVVEQRKYISEILSNLMIRLQSEEEAHREKFRMEKLKKLLPQTMSYYFEKVLGGVLTPSDRANGADCLKFIHNRYNKLIEKLKERGEYPANDVLVHAINEILYPIEKLEAFYKDRKDNTLSERDAYIFAGFISNKHSDILILLEEIDQKYEKSL